MELSFNLKKCFCAVLLIVMTATSAMAQGGIKGKILDADGLPLIGAAVMIKGTTTGTVADIDGNYTVNAKPGQTIEISCIGFKTQSILVGDAAVYDVQMEPDAAFLEEVVVVGYDTQKKVNLTGSVASVSTADFDTKPVIQVSTALQGMAAGVTVTTPGGEPGADGGNIRIRGIGSFGGSDCSPLVLIDGVEGNMDQLDATQIEQISVLKDAASASIYGNRAANGVILITTKRGSEGKGRVTYRGYVGWQNPVVYPSVATAEEYMKMSRQASDNDGATSIFTDEYQAEYLRNNYLDPDAYPITDWQKRLMTGDGFTHNHDLSLSAGNDKFKVATSLGYVSQNGIIANSNYQRINLRNNMDVKVAKRLTLRLDLSGNYQIKNTNPYQSNIFAFMNSKDPLMLAQWSDGSYAPFTGGTVNPLPMVEQNQGGINRNNILNVKGNIALEYKPWKWLALEVSAAPRWQLNKSHQFRDIVYYHSDPYGTVSPITSREYNYLKESWATTYNGFYQFLARLNFKWKGGHDFKAILGASYEDYDYQNNMAYRQDYDYPEYQVIDAGGDNEFKDNGGTRTQRALGSFFGRVNYNYKERYLIEGNIRVDGSSRFTEKNRWGVFPSVSGAWRITEENWMKPVKNTLTELKIRASYGTLGNQNIGSSNYPTAQNLTLSSISANNIIYPIATLNTLANENITWETTKMADFGVDFALWNKLSFTGDVYYKKTEGILMQLDIPSTIGLGAPYQNAGVVTNLGWELAANYRDQFGDFTLGVSANVSDVYNKIVDMQGKYATSGAIRNQEGSSINSLYLVKCLGIIQSQEQADWINANQPQYGQISQPGDLWYEDYNKDGKVDENDKQIVGCLIPRYSYGINLDFGWKGLVLTAQFQGVGKADGYMSGAYIQPCVSGGTFRSEHMDNWTPENTGARFPRLSYASDLNKKASTFWMADASYFRLKFLQLSYSLPKKWMDAIKIGGIKFFANATNLFTLTNYYQGYDPENMYQGGEDGATTGSIGSNYPLVSTYTFGLEINF